MNQTPQKSQLSELAELASAFLPINKKQTASSVVALFLLSISGNCDFKSSGKSSCGIEYQPPISKIIEIVNDRFVSKDK